MHFFLRKRAAFLMAVLSSTRYKQSESQLFDLTKDDDIELEDRSHKPESGCGAFHCLA